MDDREMLEWAAKAAGIVGEYETGVIWYKNPFGDCVGFNPRKDDGEAFRLAVKLHIQVTPGTYNDGEATAYRAGMCEAHEHVSYLQDLGAATRRAITRAAAEIGKAML